MTVATDAIGRGSLHARLLHDGFVRILVILALLLLPFMIRFGVPAAIIALACSDGDKGGSCSAAVEAGSVEARGGVTCAAAEAGLPLSKVRVGLPSSDRANMGLLVGCGVGFVKALISP